MGRRSRRLAVSRRRPVSPPGNLSAMHRHDLPTRRFGPPISKPSSRRVILACLVVAATLAVPGSLAQTASDGWEDVGPGVEYREYSLPGPVRAYVARMDRNNPDAIIDSSVASGMLTDGKETVSGMADRYDEAINAWGQTWGARNKVIVAINGSFHDLESGLPENGMIQGGWYVKRFEDLWGGSGFDWKYDRRAFVGGCIEHEPERQVVTFLRSGEQVGISGLNVPREGDSLIVYTPQYAPTTGTEDKGIEVLVEMSQPVSVVPLPHMVLGTIVQIREGKGSTPIPFDSIVLSARGDPKDALEENARVGDQIGISQEITHYDEDCRSRIEGDWTLSYASIEASWDFLKDDAIYRFNDVGATTRQPRTAICFNDDYVYFVVVDGRRAGVSIGMTIQQLADFCRGTLETTWGVNQDGGGSSTMVVNGEVKNRPSDGQERPVANGMLMIALEPKTLSERLFPGDVVLTLQPAEVRLGPGSDYAVVAQIPESEDVSIADDMAGVNGVLAKGSYWWKVTYGETIGWVQDEALGEPVSRGKSFESYMKRLEDLLSARR